MARFAKFVTFKNAALCVWLFLAASVLVPAVHAQSCATKLPPPLTAPTGYVTPIAAPTGWVPPIAAPTSAKLLPYDPCINTIGAKCADGTIYAGTSPDCNVPMYTTPCDAGQTLTGGTCTGTRSTLSWNNATTTNYTTTGVSSTTTGKVNTSNLVALADAGAPYVAANTCAGLTFGNHLDWYLPAKDELNVLYTNRTTIAGFFTGWYWSATEYDSSYAWSQRFSNGSQSYSRPKDYRNYVRCVRR